MTFEKPLAPTEEEVLDALVKSGGNEDAYGIAMDWSGNVLVGGITAKGLTGASQGKFDGYVRKLTDGATAPTVAWTHQFGTSEDDYVLSVAFSPRR